VSGFGILTQAEKLASQQESKVNFIINNFPIIANISSFAKSCGKLFQLSEGLCPEISGEFLLIYVN
jgi:hypothetical protein